MDDDFYSSLIDNTKVTFYKMGLDPLVSAMCEALNIPEIINREAGYRDESAALDHGTIVKAFIINILDERSQLLHFADSFKNKDCEVLFGEGVYAELFTEDRLGDNLDVLSGFNQAKLTTEISVNSLDLYGLPVSSSHTDTSNLTLFGNYDVDEDEKDEDFNVDYGKPKDGHSERKQVNFGCAVQQDGIPLFGEGLAGNSSDAVYFRGAMDEMAAFCTGGLYENPIMVYDAAASNIKTFNKAWEKEFPCVIRFSKRFKAARKYITKAWEDDNWQEIGVVANHNQKQAAKYSLTSYTVKLGDHDWRFLVIHSSKLEEKKEATASRNLPKKKENLTKKAVKLANKDFETEDEAGEAADKFVDNFSDLEKLFDYEIEITSETTEKYERPGRPTPDTKKIKTTTYQAVVTIKEVNQDRYEEWLQYESCFIIVSNVPEDRRSDREILKEYKEQWLIEKKYKFMKQPQVIEPIWLHRPNRIKALFFIFWLAVLVAAFLRHRLCHSLKLIEKSNEEDNVEDPEKEAKEEIINDDSNSNLDTSEDNITQLQEPEEKEVTSKTDQREEVKKDNSRQNNQQEQPKEKNSKTQGLSSETEPALEANTQAESIYEEVIEKSVSGKILLRDGRLVAKPTFNVISNELKDLKVLCSWEEGEYKREFVHGTKRKIINLIILMGFHPSIYLEPYNPGHDLFPYPDMKTEPSGNT